MIDIESIKKQSPGVVQTNIKVVNKVTTDIKIIGNKRELIKK